jgi:probable F420-dependent oxidoreductase
MRVETPIPLSDWRAAAEAARTAEQAGFDGVMSSEIANDPFAPLMHAAVATERLQLATAIAVAFPRSPMVVAQTAWDLQLNSRGRFLLGLGTQVKGHNERRFSVPWTAPVPRIREYVESLRAIWRCWEKGERLAYEGRHYRFTLMTPEFSPPPSNLPPVPVMIAAVGPDMLKLAGRVCDGVLLHGFCTRRYLEQVAIPRVLEGLAQQGRDRGRFQIWGGGFIATGANADEVRKRMDWVRYRIAFYGSTRTYRPVFTAHGWDDLGDELHRMSVAGRWKEMASRVTDDVVRTFAAVGTHAELARAIEERFGGLSDSVALEFPSGTPDGLVRELIADIRRIPCGFERFPGAWS